MKMRQLPGFSRPLALVYNGLNTSLHNGSALQLWIHWSTSSPSHTFLMPRHRRLSASTDQVLYPRDTNSGHQNGTSSNSRPDPKPSKSSQQIIIQVDRLNTYLRAPKSGESGQTRQARAEQYLENWAEYWRRTSSVSSPPNGQLELCQLEVIC